MGAGTRTDMWLDTLVVCRSTKFTRGARYTRCIFQELNITYDYTMISSQDLVMVGVKSGQAVKFMEINYLSSGGRDWHRYVVGYTCCVHGGDKIYRRDA